MKIIRDILEWLARVALEWIVGTLILATCFYLLRSQRHSVGIVLSNLHIPIQLTVGTALYFLFFSLILLSSTLSLALFGWKKNTELKNIGQGESADKTVSKKKKEAKRHELWFSQGHILWRGVCDQKLRLITVEPRCSSCRQFLQTLPANKVAINSLKCVKCSETVHIDRDSYEEERTKALLYARGEWSLDRHGYVPTSDD